MAKPSSALLLAVVVPIYLVTANKFSMRCVLLAVGTAAVALLFSAIFISGSVSAFVDRFSIALDFGSILEAKHIVGAILRLDIYRPDKKLLVFSHLLLFMAVIAAINGVISITHKGAVVAVSILFFTVTMLFITGSVEKFPYQINLQGLLIFYLSCAIFIAAVWLGKIEALKSISREQWSIAILFFIMPRIASFGTSSTYWHHDIAAAIFWLLFSLA